MSIKAKLPERTLAQRMDALRKGNTVRTKRATLKRDLKAGRASPRALLSEPPTYIRTMKLFDFVLACPSYGKVKTGKLLQICRISPAKTIEGMSKRQREAVVALLKQ